MRPPQTSSWIPPSVASMPGKLYPQAAFWSLLAAASLPATASDNLAEINNKLNNPGADLASLNFKNTFSAYDGDLPNADDQDAYRLDAQPVFPFKLDNGNNFIVRPTIPLVSSPVYDPAAADFDDESGLGDIQLVGIYSGLEKETGFIWGYGPTMQLPTASKDELGIDQYWLGPAAFAGHMGKWGSAGGFMQHWWNVDDADDDEEDTSLSALNIWYWWNIGGGYQVGGAPIIEYDWKQEDSDEALTFPLHLGVARTFAVGNTPVKVRLEAQYYIEQPDAFGPDWGLVLTVTPVVQNPFEK